MVNTRVGSPLHSPKLEIVQVTVRTKDGNPWLASQQVHMHLIGAWRQAKAWRTGHYIVLPDHLIVFAANDGSRIPISEWIRYWQSRFNRLHCKPSLRWAETFDVRPVKAKESYEHVWSQVRQTPVRLGLAPKAWDWPFQGEIQPLKP